MPRKQEEKKGGAPQWMCTFSDMMSLLLCFFVLLFSLSTIEKKKLIQASGSLRKAFGGLPAPYISEDIPNKKTKPDLSRKAQPVRRNFFARDDLLREEQRKIQNLNLQQTVTVVGTEQGITFRLSGDMLFDRGEAKLKPDALVALRFISDELIRFPSNPVKVEGHTDNTQFRERSEGNWHLAADRAYTVMRFLTDLGSERGQVAKKRLYYQSYGEFDPLPEVDTSTAIGRKLNRRVDITLLQTDEGFGTIYKDPLLKNPRTPMQDLQSGES